MRCDDCDYGYSSSSPRALCANHKREYDRDWEWRGYSVFTYGKLRLSRGDSGPVVDYPSPLAMSNTERLDGPSYLPLLKRAIDELDRDHRSIHIQWGSGPSAEEADQWWDLVPGEDADQVAARINAYRYRGVTLEGYRRYIGLTSHADPIAVLQRLQVTDEEIRDGLATYGQTSWGSSLRWLRVMEYLQATRIEEAEISQEVLVEWARREWRDASVIAAVVAVNPDIDSASAYRNALDSLINDRDFAPLYAGMLQRNLGVDDIQYMKTHVQTLNGKRSYTHSGEVLLDRDSMFSLLDVMSGELSTTHSEALRWIDALNSKQGSFIQSDVVRVTAALWHRLGFTHQEMKAYRDAIWYSKEEKTDALVINTWPITDADAIPHPLVFARLRDLGIDPPLLSSWMAYIGKEVNEARYRGGFDRKHPWIMWNISIGDAITWVVGMIKQGATVDLAQMFIEMQGYDSLYDAITVQGLVEKL